MEKEKKGRRWAVSLSASILAHAVAVSAVPGFIAIEQIKSSLLEEIIYVDVISQQEAAPEPAEGPDEGGRVLAVVEDADDTGPMPESSHAPFPSENPDADAPVTATTEARPNSPEKAAMPARGAEALSDKPETTASAPVAATEKVACYVPSGVTFAPAPDGDFATTAGAGGPVVAVRPERDPAVGNNFSSYTGVFRGRLAPASINIPGISAGQPCGTQIKNTKEHASIEKTGALPQISASMDAVSRAGATGTPGKGSLIGKGRPGSFRREAVEPAGQKEPVNGKGALIGKVVSAFLTGSPVIRTADLKEPEEAKADITITSPADNSTFDALSCGEIAVSGVVNGGDGTVRLCLNGKVYVASVVGGTFFMKFTPEAEENLLYAEVLNAGGSVSRSEKVYFKVRNINSGEFSVFLDCGDMRESVKFRCSWRPHPLSVRGDEPKFENRRVPGGEAVFVMKAAPGIYTVGLDYDSPGAPAAVARVYLYPKEPKRRKTRAIPVNLSGRGYLPAVRVLLPEGVFWEDDSWFSGMFENSREKIKFRQPEGIVWKEESK